MAHTWLAVSILFAALGLTLLQSYANAAAAPAVHAPPLNASQWTILERIPKPDRKCLAGNVSDGLAEVRADPDAVKRQLLCGWGPLRLMRRSWSSSKLLLHVAAILVEEVVGVEIEILDGRQMSSSQIPPFATRCPEETLMTLDADEEYKCPRNETLLTHSPHMHALFELWSSPGDVQFAYGEHDTLADQLPTIAQYQVAGYEALYVHQTTYDKGVEMGLHIDWYGPYVAQTTRVVERLFRSVWDVDAEMVRYDWEATVLFAGAAGYREQFPWDEDIGFEWDPDYQTYTYLPEVFITNLTDDRWWASPACRSRIRAAVTPDERATACIPFILQYPGWGNPLVTQRAVVYNISAVITVVEPEGFKQLAIKGGVVFYWYYPDLMFVDIPYKRLVFPPARSVDSNEPDFTKEQPVRPLSSVIAKDLQACDPAVYHLLQLLNMVPSEMDRILLYHKDVLADNPDADEWQAACDWVLSTSSEWQHWIPTSMCPAGQAANASVRVSETECKECPLGTYSLGIGAGHCRPCPEGMFCARSDEQPVPCVVGGYCPAGATKPTLCPWGTANREPGGHVASVCEPCAPGRHAADSGSVTCLPCRAGQMADTAGTRLCSACAQGFYQPNEGATSCMSCPQNRTTPVFGASSPAWCGCKTDSYDSQVFHAATANRSQLACDTCPPGLSCVGGFVPSSLQGASPTMDPTRPWPRIQHMVFKDKPLEAYMCLSPEGCPGGLEGCPRAKLSVACADCFTGDYFDGNSCQPCAQTTSMTLRVLTVVLLPLLALVALLFLGRPYGTHLSDEDWHHCQTRRLSATAVIGLSVSHLQMGIVFDSVKTRWADWSSSLFEGTTSAVMGRNMFSWSCLTGASEQGYLWLLNVAPLLLFVMAFMVYSIKSVLPKSWQPDLLELTGVCMSLVEGFLIFVVTNSHYAFHVYEHPGGHTWSLVKQPSIVVPSSAWVSFLVPCVAGLMLVGLLLATVVYMVLHEGSNSFTAKAGVYLLARFDDNRGAFILVGLVRKTLVGIAANLYLEPVYQLLHILGVLLLSLILTLYIFPYRYRAVNLLDCGLHSSQIFMVACQLPRTRWGEGIQEDPSGPQLVAAGTIVDVVAVSTAIFCLVCSMYAAYESTKPPKRVPSLDRRSAAWASQALKQLSSLTESELQDVLVTAPPRAADVLMGAAFVVTGVGPRYSTLDILSLKSSRLIPSLRLSNRAVKDAAAYKIEAIDPEGDGAAAALPANPTGAPPQVSAEPPLGPRTAFDEEGPQDVRASIKHAIASGGRAVLPRTSVTSASTAMTNTGHAEHHFVPSMGDNGDAGQ